MNKALGVNMRKLLYDFLSFCPAARCTCDPGYHGAACSININDRPSLSYLEVTTCDLSQSDCTKIVVYGFGFADTGSLTCHLEEVTVSSTNILGLFVSMLFWFPH